MGGHVYGRLRVVAATCGLNLMREMKEGLAETRVPAAQHSRALAVALIQGLAAYARTFTSVSLPLITLFGVFLSAADPL